MDFLVLKRVPANHPDFTALVKRLDQNLAITDGEDHAFYNQFNKLDAINNVLVGYLNETPVTCGAIKLYDASAFEIKRMYTIDEARGNGYAVLVLKALEKWAKELNATHCILETGINQQAAIALYNKCGYKRITNYGQYKGVSASFCFGKAL